MSRQKDIRALSPFSSCSDANAHTASSVVRPLVRTMSKTAKCVNLIFRWNPGACILRGITSSGLMLTSSHGGMVIPF